MPIFLLIALFASYYWTYILSILAFGFVCFSIYCQRTIKQINNAKYIWGLDHVMFDPLDQSTLISIFKMKTRPDEALEKIYTALKKMRSDPESHINRRISNEGSKYVISFQDIIQEKSQNNKKSDHDFVSGIVKKLPAGFTEKQYLQTPYIPVFGEDNSNIELAFDESSGRFYFKTNHSCYDGWTLLKIAGILFDDTTTKRYDIALPELVYYPIVFEYIFIKSIIQLLFLKKSQLALNDDPRNYKIHQIVHTQITEDMKENTDTDKLVRKTKEYGYVSLYVYKIMSVFFNSYPDRKYYNIMILAAINNPSKINNVSLMAFTVEKHDTLDAIDKKIKSRKQQIISTYFLINSFFSTSGGGHLIDVCISSIPFYKQNTTLDIIGAVVPYNSCPIYVFNSKIGQTSVSSIHFGTRVLNVDNFVESLDKSGIMVRERTILDDSTIDESKSHVKSKIHDGVNTDEKEQNKQKIDNEQIELPVQNEIRRHINEYSQE